MQKPVILLIPAPRKVADIFSAGQLERLAQLGDLQVFDEAPPTQAQFEALAPQLEILIGQLDMPQARIAQSPRLRAIFNVEGNYFPNVDYGFAMTRGISRSDRYFRQGTERYGLEANAEAYSLRGQCVCFIGSGDLGRAILPLLAPFAPHIKAFDHWLPAEFIAAHGCTAANLDEVLQTCKIVFVVASVTSQNQGFLGREAFASTLVMEHWCDAQSMGIEVQSPVCSLTGLQLRRRLVLPAHTQAWSIEHTLHNAGTQPLRCGLWDVLMLQRPGDVQVMLAAKGSYPGDRIVALPGKKACAQLEAQGALRTEGDVAHIQCHSGDEFKCSFASLDGCVQVDFSQLGRATNGTQLPRHTPPMPMACTWKYSTRQHWTTSKWKPIRPCIRCKRARRRPTQYMKV